MLASIWDNVLGLLCSKWVRIRGDSMVPSLSDGAWVRVDRWVYRRTVPRRFDVVLMEHPKRDGFWEVKRVVGLPGERVELIRGALRINGSKPDDVVSVPDTVDYQWQLQAGQYVVLGDNRLFSTDSRVFGPVTSRHIVGRVVLRQQ